MVDISVVIPVYNVEAYITECLYSVLGQTMLNYEILCIDDGTLDNSMKIVEKFAQDDSRIRIIEHPCNQGLSAARNTGMKQAKGKYVLFVDSDDMIIAETLKELFDSAERNNADIVYFDYEKIYEMDTPSSKNYPNCEYEFSICEEVCCGKELFCLFAEKKWMKFAAWQQFFKRDFLIGNKLYFKEGILHEDDLFSFFCSMKADRVININKKYYLYRQRNGSIMTQIIEDRLKSKFIIMSEIYRYWDNHQFSERVNRAIEYYFELEFQSFLSYRNYFQHYEELKAGNDAERFLYSLITNGINKKCACLSEEKINILRCVPMIIVFGAGRAANDVVEILQSRAIKIDAIAVTNKEKSAKVCRGLEVREIGELIAYKEIATVIVGVTNIYRGEVEKQLIEMGYRNLMMIDDSL